MKLKELLEKATPLEKWKIEESRISPGEFRLRHMGVEGVLTKEDATLITHTVNMLPKLVEALRALRQAVIDEFASSTPLGEEAARAMSVLEETNNPPS